MLKRHNVLILTVREFRSALFSKEEELISQVETPERKIVLPSMRSVVLGALHGAFAAPLLGAPPRGNRRK